MMGSRRAQSTVEYAILAVVVVAALLAMQAYMKRGAMGRLQDAADQQGEQFAPRGTSEKYTAHYGVKRQEVTPPDSKGATTSTILTGKDGAGEVQSRTKGTYKVEDDLNTEPLF